MALAACTPVGTEEDTTTIEQPGNKPQGPDNPGGGNNPGGGDEPAGPTEIPGQYTITFSNPEVTELTHSSAIIGITVTGPMKEGNPQVIMDSGSILVGKEALEPVASDTDYNMEEVIKDGIPYVSWRLTARLTDLESSTRYSWKAEYTLYYVELDPKTFEIKAELSKVFTSETMEFTTAPLPVSFTVYADGVEEGSVFLGSAVLQGHAVAEYNPEWSNLGMEWSTDASFPANATFRAEADDITEDLHFSVSATGLEPGTLYYYRATAHVGDTPVHSEAQEFYTLWLWDVFSWEIVDRGPKTVDVEFDTLEDYWARWSDYGFYYGPSDGEMTQKTGRNDCHHKIAGLLWPKTLQIPDLLPLTTYKMQFYLVCNDGGESREYRGEEMELTTLPQPVTGIELDVQEETLNMQHQTRKLTATIYPEDASDKRVAWSSSNEKIATVDEDGNVNFVGLGPASVTITATTCDGGYQASCAYTLGQPITKLETQHEVYGASPYLLNGTPVRIYITPDDAALRGSVQATYTCEPEGVVSYIEKNADSHFTVYWAKPGGHATVTFTAGDGSGTTTSCEFNVKGHVDMGLSKLWINTDVNVYRPWAPEGYCVAWAEQYPKDEYTKENYLWYDSNTITKYTKHTGCQLESGDDAAKLDSSRLRTPTVAEWQELINGCDWEKTTLNGTEGYLATSKANGNTLFFPHGCYWTSETVTNAYPVLKAYYVDMTQSVPAITEGYRWDGRWVRAVVE